jgi:hypothetical protein
LENGRLLGHEKESLYLNKKIIKSEKWGTNGLAAHQKNIYEYSLRALLEKSIEKLQNSIA